MGLGKFLSKAGKTLKRGVAGLGKALKNPKTYYDIFKWGLEVAEDIPVVGKFVKGGRQLLEKAEMAKKGIDSLKDNTQKYMGQKKESLRRAVKANIPKKKMSKVISQEEVRQFRDMTNMGGEEDKPT